jgi:hypothetical protein
MKPHKVIGGTLALVLGLATFVPMVRANTDVDSEDSNPFIGSFKLDRLAPMGAPLNCKPQPNDTIICNEGNQATEFTFAVPVKLPDNTILPPGKYRFVLNNWRVDKNTVTITNERWIPVKALPTIPIERDKATAETMLAFAGVPGQPPALTKWFFHGETTGHEFVYPGREGKALSEQPEVTILAQMKRNGPVTAGNLSARSNY